MQGFYQLLEPRVTVRCRQQDIDLVQVRFRRAQVIITKAYLFTFLVVDGIVLYKCFIAFQAAVNKNIPIYKEAVKSNIVVKIDQKRFLPAEM